MADAKPRKLSRPEWRRTPYAGTDAKNPDAAVEKLLDKYGVTSSQWTRGVGPNGRPAVQLRFSMKGYNYKMMLEALDADATPEETLKQIKRAIFHYLKATLEMASVFFTAEEMLFAFLELPQGHTAYLAAKPHLTKLSGPDFALLALPGPPTVQSP